MLSINADWVDSRSGVLEYLSSTGRVRNKQPVVGRTAKNNVRAQKGEIRLMQGLSQSPDHLSIPRRKGCKNQHGLSGVGGIGMVTSLRVLLKSATRAFS